MQTDHAVEEQHFMRFGGVCCFYMTAPERMFLYQFNARTTGQKSALCFPNSACSNPESAGPGQEKLSNGETQVESDRKIARYYEEVVFSF